MTSAFLAWWRARGVGSNRARLEREMEEEMRFHQEMEEAHLVAHGIAPESARRRAMMAFGSDERFKEEAREGMALRWLSDFRLDAAFALRSLRRSPVFTVVAVAALGIAIGANATVFGLVDSVAFKKLPVRDPDQLVAVFATQGDASLQNIAYSNFEELRTGVSSFSDAAAFTERSVSVGTTAGPVVAWAVLASDNYFALLGIDAAHGRLIRPGDIRNPVAVISDAFWKRQFNADPRVVGRSVAINGAPFTIVGIAPQDYRGTRLFTYDPSVWVPIGASTQYGGRAPFNVIARLRNNVSLQNAQAESNAISERIAGANPRLLGGLRFKLLPNSAPINPWLASRDRVELLGRILILGVCLVLVVACADVANLLLARMTVRRHEISIRLALGASGPRLFRQLLTESLVLAFLGALAALPLAYVALEASARLIPPINFAISFQPALNTRVLVFTLGASVFSAIAFGLAPLLQFRSRRLNPDEHDSTRTSGRSGARFRAALVVSQVAISVVALVAAGLFYRGLNAARSIDVGFDVRQAVVFTLDPALVGYDRVRIGDLYSRLEARLTALPHVLSVTRASSIPLDGTTSSVRAFATSGGTPSKSVFADYFIVGENYFSTIGIGLISGHQFFGERKEDFLGALGPSLLKRTSRNARPGSIQPTDPRAAAEPVIVNETLAERLWRGAPAVGRVMSVGTDGGTRLRVVGVAKSETSRRLGDDPQPILWRSLSHNPISRTTVIVRTEGDTAGVLARIPPIVRSLDPQLPVIGLRSLGEQVELAYSAAEIGAFAGLMFGTLAAILAAAGLFGTLTYNVLQRTREIGLRQALGATRVDIVRLIATSSARLTLLGVSIGLVAILFIPSRMSVLLYGVSPHDPLLIAIASGAFLLIAALATLGPAWKALRIEPVEALRGD